MQTHTIHHSSRSTPDYGSHSAYPSPRSTVNPRPKPAPTRSPPTHQLHHLRRLWMGLHRHGLLQRIPGTVRPHQSPRLSRHSHRSHWHRLETARHNHHHPQQWCPSWLPTSPHGTRSNHRRTCSTQMVSSPTTRDVIYSDCKSITDVINSATPQLSKFPAKLPFLQAILHHLQALKPQGVTLDWTKAHPEQRSHV